MIYKLNKITFDGGLLKQKFAYDFYKENYKPTGVVIIFDGSVSISYDFPHFMQDYPRFENSINICWEIPNINSLGNCFFKKLFLLKIKEELIKLNLFKSVDLNKNDSILIRFDDNKTKEINICLLKQPEQNICLGFIGLDAKSLKFNEKQKEDFSKILNDIFYELTNSTFLDTIRTS